MRIINSNEKEQKYKLSTTKTYNENYVNDTIKKVDDRLQKIYKVLKDIISDKSELRSFLKEVEQELYKNPSISTKSIIKRAKKLS